MLFSVYCISPQSLLNNFPNRLSILQLKNVFLNIFFFSGNLQFNCIVTHVSLLIIMKTHGNRKYKFLFFILKDYFVITVL